jgi:hypothetical protein
MFRLSALALLLASGASAQSLALSSALETSLTTQRDVSVTWTFQGDSLIATQATPVMDVVFAIVNPTDSVALLPASSCLLRLVLTSKSGHDRSYCTRENDDWRIGPGGEYQITWRMTALHLPPAPQPGTIRAVVSPAEPLSLPPASTSFFGEAIPHAAVRALPVLVPDQKGLVNHADTLAFTRFAASRTDIVRREGTGYAEIWYAAPEYADSLVAQANRSGHVRAQLVGSRELHDHYDIYEYYAQGSLTYSQGTDRSSVPEEHHEDRWSRLPPPPYATDWDFLSTFLDPSPSPGWSSEWDGRPWRGTEVETERPVILVMRDVLGRTLQRHTFYPSGETANVRYYTLPLKRGVYSLRTLGLDDSRGPFYLDTWVVTTNIEELKDGSFYDFWSRYPFE